MSEGQLLKDLLERSGKQPRDLERALGISRQMVNRYFRMSKLRGKTREKILEALDGLGIDTTDLEGSPGNIMDPDAVRALLAHISGDALKDVRTMLSSPKETRVALLALISDRIERKR